ncbi:MAG: protein translocase subunit SecD [Bacteroides sp.]|nr:protein translocase subunit SecD [Bacteroides sp.]MCM1548998.1 protein translocase subunit SecD [Clostridium sp.]
MKNQKAKSVLILVLFLLITAGCAYIDIYGLLGSGKAEDITLGLDLAGGVSITYEIDDPDATADDIADTVYRLQMRVDGYSKEGEVYRQGDNRIAIEIPGVENANEILEELGKPGALEFMDTENYNLFQAGEEYETVLTGADIEVSQAGIDNSGATNDYVVQLELAPAGAERFAEATSANIGRPIYIIYNGEVISYPTVQTVISDGSCVINNMESYEAANNLATTIRIGALPLELTEIQSNIVGAKLGEDAIQTSLLAGLIGLALIAVIMIIVYRFPGFVSVLSLLGYTVLMVLCLNLFDVTLTLPGIAGIILSIGMAVDANVIIFTRIKEEITAGKNVKLAVQGGFQKAMSAILDGNITTLIAAAVLWIMATGSVKGFAQTLALGIILSMFTALVVTKLLLNAFVDLGIDKPKLFGTIKERKVRNYVKGSKVCFVISALVILAGLVFLPINKNDENVGHILNFSMEFMGGTSMTVEFDKVFTLEEAEDQILPVLTEATGVAGSEIQLQNVQNSTSIVIKTPQLSLEQRQSAEAALKEAFTIENFSIENISSTVSSEMQRDAIVSVLIATLLMLIYIAFRFKDVRFGASAVLALLHDVLFVFTLYAVARLSVGNTFIACMLTIVGYSINATIIIFDRIRENLKVMNEKKTGLKEIVNTSISQTFTRSIYTNLTTFVMVLVLYIVGVPAIKEFALALMVGVLGGTYSSICITGPLWYYMKTKIGKSKSGSKEEAAAGK